MLKRHASISLRLTAWFAAIFLSGWVLFGAGMWINLKRTLVNERYLTLSHRLNRLQALLDKTQKEDTKARFVDYQEFARATGGGLAEVFHIDGTRAFPSPTAAAKDFPWPVIHSGADEEFVFVKSRNFWTLLRRYSLNGQTVYLAAASPEAENQLVLDRFWAGLIASAPILLLVSSLCGYWLSRRALKPVDQITAAARSISIGNLSERLPMANTGDEIERLAQTCNAMLARLESAVTLIKQFTADASHELRGPLSFVRTVAEVALRNPHTDADSRHAFTDIVDETAKATILLEDMLTLARADAERNSKRLELLNLADAVEQACEMARPVAQERQLSLTVSIGVERVSVLGDLIMLRRLIWTLLDNALKYTQAPGSIDVALCATDIAATVTVRDSGQGISEIDLPHIFDRFYRADPSRSQIEGSGLGLSIAKWMADVHDAELMVTSELHKGTVFRLVFPVCSEVPLFLEHSA
ncbi:MAG TPA: ATP-binding protein [Acidobacteriaceae bacterium]|nr:ATP-binding protein [Acidobacteriaceae bacterium]